MTVQTREVITLINMSKKHFYEDMNGTRNYILIYLCLYKTFQLRKM
jgi:hypothetical protein